MKKNRKLTALLVAACMTLPMAATTFTVPMVASATDITLSEENSSLEAYQIFTGTYANGVLGVTGWGTALKDGDSYDQTDELLEKLKNTDNTVFEKDGVNIFQNASTAIDVANVLGEYSGKDSDVAVEFVRVLKTIIDFSKTSGDKSDNTISLEDGYYIFADQQNPTSGVWSFGLLKVVGTNADTNVSEKRALPTVEKKVREEYTGEYSDCVDCEIGENVEFQITCKIPELDDNLEYYSAYYLEIQDTLGDAFDTPTDVKLTVDNEIALSNNGDEIDNKEWYYYLSDNDITIKMEDVKDYAGEDVVLTYKAKLNKKALTGNDAFQTNKTQNTNSVKIKYTNNPYNLWAPNDDNNCEEPNGDITTAESTDVIAKVFTYQLDIRKYASDINYLEGATFKLLNADKNKYLFMNDGKIEWVEKNDSSGTEFNSNSSGVISIKGLDSGTYYLEETKAPAGYNKLTDYQKVEIIATFEEQKLKELKLNDYDGNEDTGIVQLEVENKKGAQLPETGGIGTKIFYILGGTLVIGSGAALVIKKRMSKDEE